MLTRISYYLQPSRVSRAHNAMPLARQCRWQNTGVALLLAMVMTLSGCDTLKQILDDINEGGTPNVFVVVKATDTEGNALSGTIAYGTQTSTGIPPSVQGTINSEGYHVQLWRDSWPVRFDYVTNLSAELTCPSGRNVSASQDLVVFKPDLNRAAVLEVLVSLYDFNKTSANAVADRLLKISGHQFVGTFALVNIVVDCEYETAEVVLSSTATAVDETSTGAQFETGDLSRMEDHPSFQIDDSDLLREEQTPDFRTTRPLQLQNDQ